VYFSQVHFNSGFVHPDLEVAVAAVPAPETLVVIDGYHGFMALPTDLGAVEGRAFYVAGGYKYAMAGEGACFAHCPSGYGPRPRDTGWFAGFADLAGPAASSGGRVSYPAGGARFLGGTLDPTGLYRFNAGQRWLDGLGLSVVDIHAHVAGLQRRFLAAAGVGQAEKAELIPPAGTGERGHFLTFRLPEAGAVYQALHHDGVIADYRDDRLRFGFGIYHDDADIDDLARRLAGVPGWG